MPLVGPPSVTRHGADRVSAYPRIDVARRIQNRIRETVDLQTIPNVRANSAVEYASFAVPMGNELSARFYTA